MHLNHTREPPICDGIGTLKTMGGATQGWLLCAPWWSDWVSRHMSPVGAQRNGALPNLPLFHIKRHRPAAPGPALSAPGSGREQACPARPRRFSLL